MTVEALAEIARRLGAAYGTFEQTDRALGDLSPQTIEAMNERCERTTGPRQAYSEALRLLKQKVEAAAQRSLLDGTMLFQQGEGPQMPSLVSYLDRTATVEEPKNWTRTDHGVTAEASASASVIAADAPAEATAEEEAVADGCS